MKALRPPTPSAASTALVRAVIAKATSGVDSSRSAGEIARAMWGEDRDVDLILRAAASPHTLANTPVLAQIAKTFLATLVPMSAGADLLNRGVMLNLTGVAQITLPGIALPVVDFVGEGSPIPVAQAVTSGGASLTPHKLAIITALTGEMLSASNAEELVRMVLVDACGPGIDKVLLSTAAAAPDRPAGLLNGVAALTPTTAGQAKGELLVDDVQALAAAVAPVAGNGNVVLVASPDAAVALRLRLPQSVEWPVLTSSPLAARTVIAVAANAVVSAVEGTPQIDASQEALIHRDTAPTDIVPSGTMAVPVSSLWQMYSVGLRLRWPISWCLRTPSAIAWMTGVNW